MLSLFAQGQVLNQTSAWWMQHTQHIVPNALLSTPDPNVSVMRKCEVFLVEFVVRGFMTGALHWAGYWTCSNPHAFRYRKTLRRTLWMYLQSSCMATALRLQRLAQARHFCEVSCRPSCRLHSWRRQHGHVAVDALRCGRARVLRQCVSRRHAEERPAGAERYHADHQVGVTRCAHQRRGGRAAGAYDARRVGRGGSVDSCNLMCLSPLRFACGRG